MKKYILLLATAAMIVFTGCERERIITLDGSVDQKINSLIAGYESDLLGSEHGWMVSVNSKDGYYRFWMDFKVDNKVDMMTDNTRYSKYRTEVQSSSYSFRALQRPTLVFDTYSYLSIINDPDNNISGGSSNKGLVTDFEFEVVKHEPGLFTMKGRFNKVHAIFKKASAEDKAGAKNGYMMDRVNKVHEGLKNYYIFASTSTTDIVMKLYDRRKTYQFYYNAREGKGEDGYGYFNCEVDGTDDLFFPQPFKVDDIEITGLKYNKTLQQFDKFYTSKGLMDVKITRDVPEFPVSSVFGPYGSGKMYNAAITNNGLTSNLPESATYTRNALNLFTRFLGLGGAFNLIFSYNQEYFFTEENGKTYFNIFMAPQGFGIDIAGGTSVSTYETALYSFPVTMLDDGKRFRTTTSITMNPGAQKYFNANVTDLLINGYKNRTFEIKWSKVGLTEALIIEFEAVVHHGTDTRAYAPPAALYQR